MRFEITIGYNFGDYDPILKVMFFSKSYEEIAKDEYNHGVYGCCVKVPEDKKAFLNIIEKCVNACLLNYEGSLRIEQMIEINNKQQTAKDEQ